MTKHDRHSLTFSILYAIALLVSGKTFALAERNEPDEQEAERIAEQAAAVQAAAETAAAKAAAEDAAAAKDSA